MSSFKNNPHIYYKKQYVELVRHNVERGDPEYLYIGGQGVGGCLKHLNNINAVMGSIHKISFDISKILGIKTDVYKNSPEDNSNPGLLSLFKKEPEIDSNLHKKFDNLSSKIKDLEDKLSLINIEEIKQILYIVKNINEKV